MEIDFLKKIVKEAERMSRQSYEVHQKGDDEDLVTSLDTEIERYLIAQINEHYPGFDIVSEEYNAKKAITDNCFIIDPIDGTINFANSMPLWGIQIACRKNGETIASVIDLPDLNEFYYADQTGAYLNDKKISVREVPIKNAVYSVLGGDPFPVMERIRQFSKNHRLLHASCVTFAYVASGRMHGAVFRKEQPWDYEPGMFLCQMAGAKVKHARGFHTVAMNQELMDILEKETARDMKEGDDD